MKNLKMNYKNIRGITLISLVVTIIILLILAGVTINMLLGENGIIKQATNAVEKSTKSEIDERVQLSIISSISDNLGSEIEYDSLQKNLFNEFGEENVNVIENNNGTYSISINNGEYSYVIDKTGKDGERSINVYWKNAYLNGYNYENSYTNNVNIDDIIFYDSIYKTGYSFKEWQMPDGSTATKEKIYNYVVDVNNTTDLIITPIFEILNEYYTVSVKNKVQNVDYQILVDDVVQEENTFLKSQKVFIKSLDTNFAYWKYNNNIISYNNNIPISFFGKENSIIEMIDNESNINPEACTNILNSYAITNSGKNKICIPLFFYSPTNYSIIERGLLYSITSSEITIDNGYKSKTSDLSRNSIYIANMNVTNNEDKKIFYCAYQILSDSNNNQYVFYSNVQEASWNELNNNQ